MCGCEHHRDMNAPCTCNCRIHAGVRREMAVTNWKPGDVARYNERGAFEHIASGCVVIDPDGDIQVLADALRSVADGYISNDAARAALRSLITPPEPDQPGNLGAVVEARWTSTEDARGYVAQWCLAGDGSWVCLTDGRTGTSTAWPFFSQIKILSPGVTQ